MIPEDLGASLPYLVAATASAVLFWKWPQYSVYALQTLLVILCPFALSNVAQAMWRAGFLDNEDCSLGKGPRSEQRVTRSAEPIDLQRLDP